MVIVVVDFEFVPGSFERIKEEIKDAIENTKYGTDEGPMIYDWAIDVTAPNRGTIFKHWDYQWDDDYDFTQLYMDYVVAALGAANIRGDIKSYSADIYDVSDKRNMDIVLPTE